MPPCRLGKLQTRDDGRRLGEPRRKQGIQNHSAWPGADAYRKNSHMQRKAGYHERQSHKQHAEGSKRKNNRCSERLRGGKDVHASAAKGWTNLPAEPRTTSSEMAPPTMGCPTTTPSDHHLGKCPTAAYHGIISLAEAPSSLMTLACVKLTPKTNQYRRVSKLRYISMFIFSSLA
ncbi:mCG127343 [Mus musculus]|nr:mCG127343 [Mus musculus]